MIVIRAENSCTAVAVQLFFVYLVINAYSLIFTSIVKYESLLEIFYMNEL